MTTTPTESYVTLSEKLDAVSYSPPHLSDTCPGCPTSGPVRAGDGDGPILCGKCLRPLAPAALTKACAKREHDAATMRYLEARDNLLQAIARDKASKSFRTALWTVLPWVAGIMGACALAGWAIRAGWKAVFG